MPTEPTALAHMLAQKIYENEKREREERKRKREEEEAWQRQGAPVLLILLRVALTPTVNNIRLQEMKRLDEEERQSSQANRELWALFNDLQSISHAYAPGRLRKLPYTPPPVSRTFASKCPSWW